MEIMEHQPTARVVAILEALANSKEGMTLTELARAIGSSKGTISPIIRTLTARRLLFSNKDTQRYRIGIGAYCIGASYAQNMSVLDFIRSEMEYIVAQSGEICQMGILDNGQVLYVAKVDSEESIRIISHVGARLPANCTALGKAILSGLSNEAVREMYREGLPSMTEKSITDFSALEEQLQTVRETGVATEFGESNDQSNCIATPLSAGGRIVAAISVSVPVFRHTPEKDKLVTGLLLEARKNIALYLKDQQIDGDNFVLIN